MSTAIAVREKPLTVTCTYRDGGVYRAPYRIVNGWVRVEHPLLGVNAGKVGVFPEISAMILLDELLDAARRSGLLVLVRRLKHEPSREFCAACRLIAAELSA